MSAQTPPPIAVCANCVHVRMGTLVAAEFSNSWRCGAIPETALRPAGVNAITGEPFPAHTERPRCVQRNLRGECQDFQSGRNGGSGTRGGERPGEIGPGEGRPDARPADTDSTAVFLFYVVFVIGAAVGAACMAVWG